MRARLGLVRILSVGVVLIVLGSLSAFAGTTTTISGTGLSGLDYSYYSPGYAQYVAAAGMIPAYAALSTPDAGLGDYSGDAAVFAGGPWGLLSQVTMSFDILSHSGGAGNLPYGELWVDLPGYGLVGILNMGGTELNDASAIHVIYGPETYWGETLGELLNETYGGVKYGDREVEWAGVGIGDWAIDDSIGAAADIDSITVSSTVPDSTSTLPLLGLGVGILLICRRYWV